MANDPINGPKNPADIINTMQQMNNAQNPLSGVTVPVTPATPTATGAPQPQAADIPTPQAQATAPGQDALTASAPKPTWWGGFSQKLGQAVDKAGLAPGPGGWAKSLVAGAQATLAGVGDASDKPVRNGGSGILEGITETLNNRNARMTQQQDRKDKLAQEAKVNARADSEEAREVEKAKLYTATANAQMHNEQMQAHLAGNEIVDKSIAEGSAMKDRLLSAPVPGTVVQEGLTSQQMDGLIASGKLNPTYQTAFPVGKQITGTDEFGPKYATTYDVVELPLTYQLTNKDLDAFKVIPGWENVKGVDGKPITVSGAQANYLYTQAQTINTNTAIRNKQLVDAKIMSADDAKKLEAVNFGPGYSAAMAKTGNNPEAAMETLQQNPQWVAENPNAYESLMAHYGGREGYHDFMETRQKNDFLGKMMSDPVGSFEGEKAPAAIGTLQTYLKNPAISAGDRQRATSLLFAAKASQTAALFEKQSEEKTKQAITDGDPDAIAKLLVDGDVAPAEIVSSRKPEVAEAAFTRAKVRDPNFSPMQADIKYQNAKSPTNQPFFGSANSLIAKGGTFDQLEQQYAKLNNGQIPFFNKWEDYAKYQAGDPALSGFIQTLIGATDDYAKVMSGGNGGSDNSRLQLMQSFANAHNSQQFKAAADAGRAAVNSQREGRLGTNTALRTYWAPETMPRTVKTPDGKSTITFPNQAAQDAYNVLVQKAQAQQNGGK